MFKDTKEGKTHYQDDGCGEEAHNEQNREEWERFYWINKLSEYTRKFTCDDDCKMSGCPSHIAKFELHHVTDTYIIQFGDEERIALDGVRMALLLDFAYKLNSNSGAFTLARQSATKEERDRIMKQIDERKITLPSLTIKQEVDVPEDIANHIREKAAKEAYEKGQEDGLKAVFDVTNEEFNKDLLDKNSDIVDAIKKEAREEVLQQVLEIVHAEMPCDEYQLLKKLQQLTTK